jgi:hypothetical protein
MVVVVVVMMWNYEFYKSSTEICKYVSASSSDIPAPFYHFVQKK